MDLSREQRLDLINQYIQEVSELVIPPSEEEIMLHRNLVFTQLNRLQVRTEIEEDQETIERNLKTAQDAKDQHTMNVTKCHSFLDVVAALKNEVASAVEAARGAAEKSKAAVEYKSAADKEAFLADEAARAAERKALAEEEKRRAEIEANRTQSTRDLDVMVFQALMQTRRE